MRERVNEMWTVEEAAEFLRVHPKSLYAAIRAGEVPGVVKLGRTIRLNRSVLEEWTRGSVDLGKSAREAV